LLHIALLEVAVVGATCKNHSFMTTYSYNIILDNTNRGLNSGELKMS